MDCENCGNPLDETNEDEAVLGLCVACMEFGMDWEVERGDGLEVHEYCNCEDYPCCGH